ncbi:ferritin-like fold-containing protein [Propionibacteriaceae bacterium Y1923]|uniref:ferritin-like fold-containing protein n=1 Tax=Aestuariimicrobium sp. Y1814 TaxID=3418742 RepID=UPI003C19CF08
MTATSSDDVAIAALHGAGWLLCYETLAELSGLAPQTLEALGVARTSAGAVEAARRSLALVPADSADQQVGPIRQAFASLQQHTPPGTWPEALVKNLLLIGMGLDLVRHTREHWPPAVAKVLEGDPGPDVAELVTQTLAGLDLDDEQRSRTSLFGRRVIAEMSAQAQRIVSRESRLARALTGTQSGTSEEVARTTELLQALVEGAAERMLALGLQP